MPDVTEGIPFSGGFFQISGQHVFQYLNATNQLLVWSQQIYISGSSAAQWLCPGSFGEANGDFSVQYSSSEC